MLGSWAPTDTPHEAGRAQGPGGEALEGGGSRRACPVPATSTKHRASPSTAHTPRLHTRSQLTTRTNTDSQCHLCSDTDTGGGRHADSLRWGRFSTSAAQGPPQCPAARRECATFPTWSLRCPVRRSVLNDLTQGQDRRRGRVSREGGGILSQLDWVNTATWGRWVSGP